MPKTVITRQTWHCTGCEYESDRIKGSCSTNGCTGTIYEETDPARCGTLTIIGMEDVHIELQNINTERISRGQTPLPASARDQYIADRMAEIELAIATARLRERRVEAGQR